MRGRKEVVASGLVVGVVLATLASPGPAATHRVPSALGRFVVVGAPLVGSRGRSVSVYVVPAAIAIDGCRTLSRAVTKLPGTSKLTGTFRCGKNVLTLAATVRGPTMHGSSRLKGLMRRFTATRAKPPGVELRGASSASAVAVISNVFRPERQSAQFVSKLGRVLVARREVLVELKPGATVGQVNRVLGVLQGGITASVRGTGLLVVGIADPGSTAGLQQVVVGIRSLPGVASADVSPIAAPADLPPRVARPPTNSQRDALSHLLASRVAAAWNARGAVKASGIPTTVIEDYFGSGRLSRHVDASYDPRRLVAARPGLMPDDHGYHVTGIVFGDFANDGTPAGLVTGVFPAHGRLVPIDVIDLPPTFAIYEVKLVQTLDAIRGPVVVNTSIGSTAPETGSEAIGGAARWIALVRASGYEARVLHATAAGNEARLGGVAANDGDFSAAAVRTDVVDPVTRQPVKPLTNTLSVENADELADASALECLSPTSNTGGSVAAPGVDVYSFNHAGAPLNLSGTSMASPVVAGLATYLWSIAPDLTPQQVISAILANSTAPPFRCGKRTPAPEVDAYKAVLSLDAPASPNPGNSPVRLAILDLNGDGAFTEADLRSWVAHVAATNHATRRDWSRFDLNGDGFTGGGHTTEFDLDRAGSVRAGKATIGMVTDLNGTSYDESAVTDQQALCYYTYSSMYTGSDSQRRQLLPPAKCGAPQARNIDILAGDASCRAGAAGNEGPPGTQLGQSNGVDHEPLNDFSLSFTAEGSGNAGAAHGHANCRASLTDSGSAVYTLHSDLGGDASSGDPSNMTAGGGGLSSFNPHFVTLASVHYRLTGTFTASPATTFGAASVQLVKKVSSTTETPITPLIANPSQPNASGTLAPGEYFLRATCGINAVLPDRPSASASLDLTLTLTP
jgi:Subtilase family